MMTRYTLDIYLDKDGSVTKTKLFDEGLYLYAPDDIEISYCHGSQFSAAFTNSAGDQISLRGEQVKVMTIREHNYDEKALLFRKLT